MIYATYKDDGPIGPGAQDMSRTMPWKLLYIFESYQVFRRWEQSEEFEKIRARRLNARFIDVYGDNDEDIGGVVRPARSKGENMKQPEQVFRHWWHKEQIFRAFLIGFKDDDFYIQDGGCDGRVRLSIKQLDEFIDALQHVRNTMVREGEETPTFARPSVKEAA